MVQWNCPMDDHAGLPDTFIAAAKAAAEERGYGRQGDRDAVANRVSNRLLKSAEKTRASARDRSSMA